jgi:hypothetical protein
LTNVSGVFNASIIRAMIALMMEAVTLVYGATTQKTAISALTGGELKTLFKKHVV